MDEKEKEYLNAGVLLKDLVNVNSKKSIIGKYRKVLENVSMIKQILENENFDENLSLVLKIISLLTSALEIEESIIQFKPSELSLITEMFFNLTTNLEYIKSLNVKFDWELEEKLSLIQGHVSMKDFHKCLDEINLYRKKIKTQKIFSFLGSSCAFSQKYDKAIKTFDSGLKIDPSDYELIYLKNAVHRIINDKQGKETYLMFLDLSPKDHRKVPEAYYSLASFEALEHKFNEAVDLQ